MIFNNSSRYEGMFKNGELEGFGKMVQANGDTYEGSWKSNKKYGKGTYVDYGKS
mgnify:CR=1 FL=1|jgi:hypothetical protein